MIFRIYNPSIEFYLISLNSYDELESIVDKILFGSEIQSMDELPTLFVNEKFIEGTINKTKV